MLFSRKAKKHGASPLMQSPVEVRLMILRLLLVHDGPLRARNWYGEKPHPKIPRQQRHLARLVRERKEEVASSYNLSPEILSTCQTLYNEGLPFLYSSNTLGLQICEGDTDPDSWQGRWWGQCGCGSPDCHGGMFVYAVPYICTTPYGLSTSKVLELVRKFDKLHIDINNETPRSTYNEDAEEDEVPIVRGSLLALFDTLRNKSVQVKFINPDRDPDIEAQLADLILIRCKEFKILNTDFPASDVSDAWNVSTVTSIVTSDLPILNLHHLLEDLKLYIEAICRYSCLHTEEYGHECEFADELDRLSRAACEGNAVKFYKLRAELMNKLDRTTEWLRVLRKRVFEGDVASDEAGLPART